MKLKCTFIIKVSVRWISCLWAFVLLSGCSEVGTDYYLLNNWKAPVTIDSVSYYSESNSYCISYTYQNRFDELIYYNLNAIGDGVWVEKKVNGKWKKAYVLFAQLNLADPIVIKPDSTFSRNYAIRVPHLTDQPVGYVEEAPGTYRMVLALCKNWSYGPQKGDLLPKKLRVSESFTIE